MTDGKATSKEKSDNSVIPLPTEFKIGDKTVHVSAKPLGVLKIIARKVVFIMGKLTDDRLLEVKEMKDPKKAVDLIMSVFNDAFDEFVELIQIILEPANKVEACRGEFDFNAMEVSKDDLEWHITIDIVSNILKSFVEQNKAFGDILKNVQTLRIV